jgi:hypothetical protein
MQWRLIAPRRGLSTVMPVAQLRQTSSGKLLSIGETVRPKADPMASRRPPASFRCIIPIGVRVWLGEIEIMGAAVAVAVAVVAVSRALLGCSRTYRRALDPTPRHPSPWPTTKLCWFITIRSTSVAGSIVPMQRVNLLSECQGRSSYAQFCATLSCLSRPAIARKRLRPK